MSYNMFFKKKQKRKIDYEMIDEENRILTELYSMEEIRKNQELKINLEEAVHYAIWTIYKMRGITGYELTGKIEAKIDENKQLIFRVPIRLTCKNPLLYDTYIMFLDTYIKHDKYPSYDIFVDMTYDEADNVYYINASIELLRRVD